MRRFFTLFILSLITLSCSKSEESQENPFASDNEKLIVDGMVYENDRIRFEITGSENKGEDDGKGFYIIQAEFTNLDKNKRIYSPSWSDSISIGMNDDVSEKLKDFKPATIEDEHGNLYAGFMTESSKTVMPGKTVDNGLSFMQLVPTAKKLKMTLVGNQYTDGKDLVFKLNREELENNQK